MMNVKETLKRLHRRLPTLSLDELFELLDCYVEQSNLTSFPNWEPGKIWYSTDTTGVNETAKVTCVTNNTDKTSSKDPLTTNINFAKIDPLVYKVETNVTNGKTMYYDGGDTVQLTADH